VGRLTRRQALAALSGSFLTGAGCNDDRGRRSITASEQSAKREPLPFNVHPFGGRLGSLQEDALRRMGTPWIRITLGLVSDTEAARPYMRAAPNVLGLVADFRPGTIEPAGWPDLVEATLRRYPQVRLAELLKAPDQLNGLSPERYVREFLRPGYERIRARLPGVSVVAASPGGDRRRLVDAFRRMTEAGADDVCDLRGVHVYFEDPGTLSAIAGATRRPIIVGETGVNSPGQHVRWYSDVIPQMRSTLRADLVFWYVLLESPAFAPGPVPYSQLGSSVIAPEPDAAGQAQAASGSALFPLLTGTALTRRR